MPFERIIDLYSLGRKSLFFIEIGACDGLWHDPINKFIKRDKWRGILIEPVKYLFEELVSNYSWSENLIFENIAISDRDGTREFYYLAKNTVDNLTGDYKGLGTFRRELLSYLPPEAEIVSEKINCLRLETLLEKHNVKRLDLLLIDTEGYDYSIIKQIDFNRIQPDILVYEHKHLHFKEYYECIRYLKKNKYTLYKEADNIIALSDSCRRLFLC